MKCYKFEQEDLSLVRQKAFGGKQKIQDMWENVPYVVMEKPYSDVPVYKIRLNKHNDKCSFLYCNLLFPLFRVQQDKLELDQKSQQNRKTLCTKGL